MISNPSADRRACADACPPDAAPLNCRQALTLGPRLLLTSGWPWRSLGYLSCGGAVVFLIMAAAMNGLIYVDNLPDYAQLMVVVVLAAATGMPVAAVERLRLRIVDTERVGNPHVAPDAPGLKAWLWLRIGEAATWREFSYAIALTAVLPLIDFGGVLLVGSVVILIAAPFLEPFVDLGPLIVFGHWHIATPLDRVLVVLVGLVLLPAAAYLVTALAAGRAAFVRLLLAPRESEVVARVQELTRSRIRLADAFEAERKRIERDLHDGAQQRLVGLIMTLGIVEHGLEEERSDRAVLVAKARKEAEGVLADLRELIRGIHPQLLTDRGVPAAVAEIADRSPVPVHVDITLPERLVSAVETVAYFAVKEALTNVVKHSGARRAWVTGCREGDRLVLCVGDDGVGGARPEDGRGLQGLADRVAVVGGRLKLLSPSGGPTELVVELPWRTPDSA
ncbi:MULTISPECIES: sensor histidine kinase [Streptomyces]|uniref:sensor histidine kinase n=1 Tax=Streptomyces TaxID=1883 RepID=UPI000AC428E5|nr:MULTISPECIES: sensor histidine kinase [Streptomyces]